MKFTERKIIVVNQATNYLTIGFCNALNEKFQDVTLLTGSVHTQGEKLKETIQVSKIRKYESTSSGKKFQNYIITSAQIWWLLLTKFPKHEVFFVSLPPMAYLLNIVLPHRFSMVIWDVYPDVLKITGMSESNWAYRLWAELNRKSFRKAYRLFTISERMADLVAQYVNPKKIIVQPIWSIFQSNEKIEKSKNPFIKKHKLQEKFIVQYSGNIGLTHNVEILITIAKKMQDYDNILFQIIGRGPRRAVLEKEVKDQKLKNCQFLPFQSDEMFPFSLSAADLGVVILDEMTSKGSVPSKSYNLMSYGIPSLYIASPDSQLQVYAEKYQHAICLSKSQTKEIEKFILDLSNSPTLQASMSVNALNAAEDFRRNNADKFVEKYINTKDV